MAKLLKASDLMAKFKLERCTNHYDLNINGCVSMCFGKYSEIVSKSRPSTYDQVLIGEVLEILDAANVPWITTPHPHIFSKKIYGDLKSTFERSREAGEAKALALAKKLYLDDFNYMMQTGTWAKITNGSSGVLGFRLLKDKGSYCHRLRFNDGVDSITVDWHPFLVDHFSFFWYFKARKIKEMISILSNNVQHLKFTSSIRDVKGETLLKALELALRHNTTLGAALFLTAKE